MGGNQGCCSGKEKQEITLEAAARNGRTPGSKDAFFKRQSTSLDIRGSLTISNMNAFYGNLVISCTGRDECHSKFSKLCLSIQQNVGSGIYDDENDQDDDEDNDDEDDDENDGKESKLTEREREERERKREIKIEREKEKQIIRGALWTKAEKLRKYFILLLEKTENNDKYDELYDNLNDETYKVDVNNAQFILKQFIKMIENNDEYLLQCLANFTCTFGSRPLWDEIRENIDQHNNELNEKAILDKVEEVEKGKFFLELKQKGIILEATEILAVYIYTVNTEFADLMQKHLKIPCKWKQTFYYFVRGILKIYDAVVYKENINKLPNSLYHPIFGQSKISEPFQILSTINCTASESTAKDMAPPDGTMYVFHNVSSSLSKGKLIAAPIQWISPDPTEEEWVILPLKILEIKQEKEEFDAYKKCKQITIEKYQSFSINLYGVDLFGKLNDLKIVKDLKSKNKI